MIFPDNGYPLRVIFEKSAPLRMYVSGVVKTVKRGFLRSGFIQSLGYPCVPRSMTYGLNRGRAKSHGFLRTKMFLRAEQYDTDRSGKQFTDKVLIFCTPYFIRSCSVAKL